MGAIDGAKMSKLSIKKLNSLTLVDVGSQLTEDGNIRGKVRATKTGVSVDFSYRYRFGKLNREIRLGSYPNIGLTLIRENHLRAKILLSEGKDPLFEKELEIAHQAEKQLNDRDTLTKQKLKLTVKDLFNSWKLNDLTKRKNVDEIERMFTKDVFPVIGSLKAEDISKYHIRKICDNIISRGALRMPSMILSLTRQMFLYGVERDLITKEPTSSIRKSKVGGKSVPRERRLEEGEIIQLKEKMSTAKLLKNNEYAIWIMLSTCCRVGEITKAKWSEIDFDNGVWKIPSENSKNNMAHIVYLSNFAMEQFKGLLKIKQSNVWVLPNAKNTNHLNVKAISKQVCDRQRDLDKILKNRTSLHDSLKLSEGKWTPHDLRRSASSLMGDLGTPDKVIDKCINHLEEVKMRKPYHLYELRPEKALAWKKLGEYLTKILDDNYSNIVQLHPRAA